jgi:glycolate dehydrogenase FAD-binding subunit
MTEAKTPTDEKELAETVAEAAAAGKRIEIAGCASKRGYGHKVEADLTLATGGLTGISLYEPASLTLIVRAGTPLEQVESVLARENQHLPFEPPRLNHLYGTKNKPTIGGTIACGLSGPRRIQAGAARDSLIGVRFVTGSGERVKNGGRVMKNVTGYDLVKLMCGSHGTLGVLTELSFKLLPRPETSATLLIADLDDTTAQQAMTAVQTSPFDVTGAAHDPQGEGGRPVTMIRIEGFKRSVDYRAERLRELLAEFGPTERENEQQGAARWAAMREAVPVAGKSGAIWRLSVRPSDGPAIVAALAGELELAALYDWGGGLVWLRTEEKGDCGAAAIRRHIARRGGHATLMRAGDGFRDAVPVFQPQLAEIARISARLRQQFDPRGILNPGRMSPMAMSGAA